LLFILFFSEQDEKKKAQCAEANPGLSGPHVRRLIIASRFHPGGVAHCPECETTSSNRRSTDPAFKAAQLAQKSPPFLVLKTSKLQQHCDQTDI
jgi:hypothetical protein